MNNRSISIYTAISICCLLLFTCRKDINNIVTGHEISETALEAAKIYHSINAKILPTKSKKFIKVKPLWNDAWSLGSYLVVPTRENYIENKSFSVRRVFLFSLRNSRVVECQIIEFVGKDYDVTENLDYLIKNNNNSQLSGFNGGIVRYDINYFKKSSAVFSDGKKLEGDGKWINSRPARGELQITKQGKIMAVSIPNKFSYSTVFIGTPYPVQAECTYHYWRETHYDEDGNIELITNTYQFHTCPAPAQSSGSVSGGQGSNGVVSGSMSIVIDNEDYGGNEDPEEQPNPDEKDCAGVVGGSAVMAACGCILGTTQIPSCSKELCKEMKIINRKLNELISKQKDVAVRNNTAQPGNKEWGYEIVLDAPYSNHLKPTQVRAETNFGDNKFGWSASWNGISGYFIGGSHGHNTDTGPSGADAVALGAYSSKNGRIGSNMTPAHIDTYVASAMIVTVTPSTTYVITIKDTTAMTANQQNYNADPEAAEADIIRIKNEYLLQPHHPSSQDAFAYALLVKYGNAINMYKAPTITDANQTRNFVPLKGTATSNLSTLSCPN